MTLPKLNKVVICGRITQDVQLKHTGKGTALLNVSLAVDKSVKDVNGQFQNQASFFDVVIWDKTAEYLSEKASKGSALLIVGRLEGRSYTDSNNVKRKAIEIIAETVQLLDDRKTEQATDQAVMSDDVPF